AAGEGPRGWAPAGPGRAYGAGFAPPGAGGGGRGGRGNAARQSGAGACLDHDVDARGSRPRVGDWDDRVALLPCVRPEARLLSYWCDGSDGRRRVEAVDVLETPAG